MKWLAPCRSCPTQPASAQAPLPPPPPPPPPPTPSPLPRQHLTRLSILASPVSPPPHLTRFPKYFAMGTVVANPADFYSGRMEKAQRKKATLTDQLLADSEISQVRRPACSHGLCFDC